MPPAVAVDKSELGHAAPLMQPPNSPERSGGKSMVVDLTEGPSSSVDPESDLQKAIKLSLQVREKN